MLKKKNQGPREAVGSPHNAQETGTENLQVDILNAFV